MRTTQCERHQQGIAKGIASTPSSSAADLYDLYVSALLPPGLGLFGIKPAGDVIFSFGTICRRLASATCAKPSASPATARHWCSADILCSRTS